MEILEEHAKLKSEIEALEAKITDCKNTLIASCVHGVMGAKFFPNLCKKCARDFVLFCEKNDLKLDVDLYANAINDILIERENERIYQEQLKQKQIEFEEQEREKLKKQAKAKWDARLDIYENKENLSHEEIGKRYERYVGYIFETLYGYRVIYNGIIKKFDDRGVDLIVKPNSNEFILVQCKMWGKDKDMGDIVVSRIGFAKYDFAKKHPNKKIRAMLVTHNNNLNEELQKDCRLHEIEYNCDIKYDPNYPKIKCNLESGIYHLPDDFQYDIIDMSKPNREYVATIEQAEKLGCRRQEIGVPKILK